MKRIILLLSLVISINCISKGQNFNNIVANSSFEDTISCPNFPGQISKATGWVSHGASPDYMNNCAPSPVPLPLPNVPVSVPYNYWGIQIAASGNAYAGFGCYQAPASPSNPNLNSREIIGRNLNEPMIIGGLYYVRFKVSLAEYPLQNNGPSNIYGVNKLGVYFSKTTPYNFSAGLPNFAHVYSDTIISDTTLWITISDTFVATDSFDIISIGVFYDDDSLSFDTLGMGGFSYYYLDDIYVGNDDLHTGIIDESLDNLLTVYPNPTSSLFTIEGLTKPYNLSIYNAIGKLLYMENNILETSKKIDASKYGKGLIFIRIESKDEVYYHKVIKK